MKWIDTRSATGRSGSRVHLLLAMVVALCAVFVACPALAQEEAAASGGDISRAGDGQSEGAPTKGAAGAADGAAMTKSGIDPVTPQRGPAGLQRRANLKALVAGAPRRAAAGPPVAHARVAPLPTHPGTAFAAPRNAIGSAMPSIGLPGHDVEPTTTQAGTRLTGLGSAAGNAGVETRRMPVPASAPPALHGAGINGTAMGRMSSGPPSIGGPAKDRSGINGTLIRPKH